MEQIGDIIERVLQDVEDKKIKKGRSFSEAGMAEIVRPARAAALEPAPGDERLPRRPRARRASSCSRRRRTSATSSTRTPPTTSRGCASNTAQSIETSSLHLDLISDLKRINSHICSVAYPILESAGALTATRIRQSQFATLTPVDESGAHAGDALTPC